MVSFVVKLVNGATQVIEAEDYQQDQDLVIFRDAAHHKVAALRASNVQEIRPLEAA